MRPSRRRILRRSSARSSHSGSLRPLRAGGLDRTSVPPESRNYVMAASAMPACSARAQTSRTGKELRRYDPFSRQEQSTASTRNTSTCAARSRRRTAAHVGSGSRKPSGSAFVSTMVQPIPPRRSGEFGAQVSASCADDVSPVRSASTTSARVQCAGCVIGLLPSRSSTPWSTLLNRSVVMISVVQRRSCRTTLKPSSSDGG